jgi:hypothetical protein
LSLSMGTMTLAFRECREQQRGCNVRDDIEQPTETVPLHIDALAQTRR